MKFLCRVLQIRSSASDATSISSVIHFGPMIASTVDSFDNTICFNINDENIIDKFRSAEVSQKKDVKFETIKGGSISTEIAKQINFFLSIVVTN